MGILINWLASAVAIGITAYVLPGVDVVSFGSALILALVLGIINVTLKPLLHIFTLPITILTLGLFGLVINAALILLASLIVPGFKVDGFLSALLFSIVLSVVNLVLNKIVK
ncbi:MAG TPA: phage holin family protein [Candidatus Nitrosocosmicus sp.]|nr:phage holin family protein [Candidatus Nitrosocosmicus sp.]